jgi:hypothetical protein
MKSIAGLLLLAIISLFWTSSTASAQFDDGWWFLEFKDTTGAALQPLNVGIDAREGRGFGFVTVADDDGDGVIHLPRVPVGGRLAIGGADANGDVGCDLWDLVGAQVYGTTIQKSLLLIIAEDVEEVTLGVDYGDFTEPPFALTPGARYTVTDGGVAEWPEVRFVNDFGVPGLEEFVQSVDSLPNFNGDVIVSTATLTGTFVPEPVSLPLLFLGAMEIAFCQRTYRRA